MKPLAGKVALVTGGTRGIGRAIALELAEQGADVVVNYMRREETALATVAELEQRGVRARAIRAHLAEPEKIDRLFAEIGDAFGRLDILINNAASGVFRPPTELEVKHWDWTMDISARAPWYCARQAAPLMREGGSIVNISSIGSFRVTESYFAVGVAKAALEAITRYLAVELAPRGIVVNAVCAGAIEGNMPSALPAGQEKLALMSAVTPAGRAVRVEEVAYLVAFLCSDRARMIRGQTIVIDGGFTLR